MKVINRQKNIGNITVIDIIKYYASLITFIIKSRLRNIMYDNNTKANKLTSDETEIH